MRLRDIVATCFEQNYFQTTINQEALRGNKDALKNYHENWKCRNSQEENLCVF